MLAKLNKISSWQAVLIIVIVGFAVFFSGLATPFRDDDINVIVNNPLVHTVSHLRLLFDGSTFYNGQGAAPLAGSYYRPLMMVVFSLLYTVFGPHPLYFHFLQLMLCIGSAIILYLFFKFSFKPALALFLALVFLVHPIDSQVVFYISQMQDVLFFFFGILAVYLLIRFKSVKSLLLVALCLFLSMLSKETAIVFIAMSLLYLLWFNRERLMAFLAIIVVPVGVYLALKIHAVGLNAHLNVAPINNLNLAGRLMTAPSIGLFYLSKFIFPWRLATSYYWVHPTFSVRYVLVPLIIDLAVIGLVIYMGILIRKRAAKAQYYTYLFFATWAFLGLLTCLQIIPIDMTACETWFYFSMAGLLGMSGVVLTVFPLRIRPSWVVLVLAMLLIGTLGLRTALRGLDYTSKDTMAYADIVASPDDYTAYDALAQDLINQGNLNQAKIYTLRSIAIYPSFTNYLNLGVILTTQGDYPGALQAYNEGLKYGNFDLIYNDLAALTLLYGNPPSDVRFFTKATELFPQDATIWTYLAILEDQYNDNAKAQVYISKAAVEGPVASFIYDNIMSNQPFTIILNGKSIQIP